MDRMAAIGPSLYDCARQSHRTIRRDMIPYKGVMSLFCQLLMVRFNIILFNSIEILSKSYREKPTVGPF
jgi:hypothetical protein